MNISFKKEGRYLLDAGNRTPNIRHYQKNASHIVGWTVVAVWQYVHATGSDEDGVTLFLVPMVIFCKISWYNFLVKTNIIIIGSNKLDYTL